MKIITHEADQLKINHVRGNNPDTFEYQPRQKKYSYNKEQNSEINKVWNVTKNKFDIIDSQNINNATAN